LLNSYKEGQDVKIDLNLRGREWINPEGVAKYFNAIQGWRIESLNNQTKPVSTKLPEVAPVSFLDEEDDGDLPF
jgi:translation initiation factor IF-3